MKAVLLFVFALALIQLPNEGNADCCHGTGLLWALKCKDCSKATPYCARDGKCNLFGCNCDGGCKKGPCEHHGHHPMKPQEPVPYGGGSYGSYDNKPEAPYYSSSASSYGSVPQYGTDHQVEASVEPDTQGQEVAVDTSDQESENMQSVDTSDQESENMQSVDTSDQESENMQSVDTSDQESEIMQSVDTSGQESENMQSVDTSDQEIESMQSVDTSDQESENMQSVDMIGQENETEGSTDEFGQEHDYEQSRYEREISTPEDLIQAADMNGDGLMDMHEAEKYLLKRGVPTFGPYGRYGPYGSRVKRSLLDFDRNNDNFLSADEIEPSEDK